MISNTSSFLDFGRSLRSAKTIPAACLISLSLICAHPLLAQDSSASKTPRRVLVTVQPQYPPVLKDGHFEGQVRLAATVLPNGNVARVKNLGGNPMLSQYAEKAVMQWKYAPAPAQTVEEVVFNFSPGGR